MRFAGLGMVIVCALGASAGSAAAAQLQYDVTAHIDSNDFLMIKADTFQWHHVDTGGAAVGRHSGNNFPTTISSSLDSIPQMSTVQWTPTWPLPVPAEIRFDAVSSILTGVTPALPDFSPVSVQVSTISGRGSLAVTQMPSALNDYTLIVRFSDGFNGSQDLRGMITVITPEPAGFGAAAMGLGVLARRRRHS